jgi:hypothetical protein
MESPLMCNTLGVKSIIEAARTAKSLRTTRWTTFAFTYGLLRVHECPVIDRLLA